MRKLEKPNDNARDVFLECIRIVRRADLKARLTATQSLIIDASTELENKVSTGQVYTIIQESIVNGNVTAKELEEVYKNRMVKKDTPGRVYYDKLIVSAPNGICPLCSHREVTTLDHYLPKTKYPRLAVAPVNLIPSCTDCNKSKLISFPTSASEETLHPYFDNIENDLWLKAVITHSTPPTFHFQVNPPNNWPQLLSDRVQFHFTTLSLNKLYSTHAAVELAQINKHLENLLTTSGNNAVKNYLLEGANTRAHENINSWQAAIYTAMATDNWFCNGGFRLIL